MILIADSGATKTSWCLINTDNEVQYFDTEGYNPYFADGSYILKSLNENLPSGIPFSLVKEVHYYGAGCFPGKDFVLRDAIKSIFYNATVCVELDLLAAARALLGQHAGFAAILGTGMNTCMYDGKKIVQNIDSLGFVLGDEGSGAAIGKKLLSDFIREKMPKEIAALFYETFHLTKEDIFYHIYDQPFANRFCAEYCKFVNTHLNYTYFHDLVKSSFVDLFQNLVTRYPEYQNYSFNCVGSVGYSFKDILQRVAQEFGMRQGNIIKSPLDGLVEYHKNLRSGGLL